jgi:benzoate transport
MTPLTLREKIDSRGMTRIQWGIVAIATVLMMAEGYDVQAMAFTSNAVTEDFGLNGTELGILLSGGLIGMAVGSVGLAPLADRLGRRPMLLIALAINTLGVLLSATAGSFTELLSWRLLTGLGVGAMMTSGIVLVSEFASAKYRPLALAIYSSGFPIGATIGGLAAVPLISNFGWQSVFLVGGVLTLIILVVAAPNIPESIDYVTARYRRGDTDKALRQAAVIARRLRVDGDIILTHGDEPQARNTGGFQTYGMLFAKGKVASTVTVWLLFFTLMACFYFINSWTPRLFTERGLSPEWAIYSAMMLMAGGLVGTVSFGFCATRWEIRRTLSVFAVVSAVLMVAFVASTSVLVLTLAIGLLLGIAINGCMAGLYGIAPMAYSTELRATGVGAAMAMGRVGGITAPIIIGALLDAGWTAFALYALGSAVALIAAGIVLKVRLEQRQAATSPEETAEQAAANVPATRTETRQP